MSKSWWRIQVDSSGKVVDCRVVEGAESNTGDVFYVRAADRAEAGRKAWNAYSKLAQRRKRARHKAEGRCMWCGRANDREPHQRCTGCLAAEREREAIHRARSRGEDVPPPDRAASIAARAHEQKQQIRAEAATETRLSVLSEVQQAWQDAPNNAAFTRWLAQQVEALVGRRVA